MGQSVACSRGLGTTISFRLDFEPGVDDPRHHVAQPDSGRRASSPADLSASLHGRRRGDGGALAEARDRPILRDRRDPRESLRQRGCLSLLHRLLRELAGGSSNGYKILADSNCDWGQELKALSVYLKKTTPGPIYLSYFGNIDPADYGIAYEALHPAVDAPMTRDRMVEAGQPGTVLLAVSATNRQGLYYKRHDTFQWLDSLRPVSVLGHTLFVYDITRDARAHREMSRLYAEAGLTDRVNNELDWVKRLEAGS